MTSTPHDALFKAVFEAPEHAAGLFRCVLPPACADSMVWSTLAPEAGSFIDPALGKNHTDLLFSVDVDGTRAYLYLLLEHQSSNDPHMPFRVLRYLERIWERHRKEQSGRAFPIVIPIVVSHAPEGWTSPREFHALFEPDPASIPDLAQYVPAFSIIVEDLTHLDNEQLKARALAAFAKLALWVLRDARDATRLLQNLEFWASAFREAKRAPYGAEALGQLFRYVSLVVGDVQFEQFRARLVEQVPETEEAIVTYAEKLEAKGMHQGQIGLLAKLLVHKFGELPSEHRGRLEAANPEQIDRYAERILTAATLDEVFAEPGREAN